jgi:hypothetical protein
MLKFFVSYILGPFGLKILDFYIHNSAIINSIVFLYGIFLAISHANYKRITNKWIQTIKNGQGKQIKNKNYKINWEKEIKENSNFPFISAGSSLVPKRTSVENLTKLLAKDKTWQKKLAEITTGK